MLWIAVKDQYESISSIHIYSLSPYRLQDLQTLTDIGGDLFNTVFIKEDPLLHNKTYGVIQNSGVRRRTGKGPPISEAPTTKFKPIKEDTRQPIESSTTPKISSAPPTLKQENSSRPNSAGSMTTASSARPQALKRDTSDIFKSFAKAKSKPKTENKETDASTNGDSLVQSGPEDINMTDADEEGESEDEALFLDTKTRKPARKRASEEGHRTKDKHERAAKLRKMMDSDDESEPVAVKTEENREEANEKETEDANVAWSDSESDQPKATKPDGNPPKEEPTTTSTEPTRRRGRRKVMKKRTMKDEEGYLVTKEEAVWESFSEDEPVSQPKSKAAFPTKTPSYLKSSTGSGKASGKVAGKGGNIMSFFGKK
jgi:DNA polymerase delta subunit 3